MNVQTTKFSLNASRASNEYELHGIAYSMCQSDIRNLLRYYRKK